MQVLAFAMVPGTETPSPPDDEGHLYFKIGIGTEVTIFSNIPIKTKKLIHQIISNIGKRAE